MSLIINQILPFISLLKIDRVIDILWYFLLLLDAIVYSVVVYVYNIFQIVAQLNFSVISSWTQPLVNRVEALIMVLILFKLGMSFIQYMITPEKFNDKATGGSALLINIVICSVLLVSYQFIFTVFNELSMLIIGYQDGYEFTVLKQIADVESENGGDEAGLIGRFIFGTEADTKDFGKEIAGITLFSFLKDKVKGEQGERATLMLGKILENDSDDINFFEITNIADAIYRSDEDDDLYEHGCVVYQFPLLSTAVGIYLVYRLVVLTIEVAIRIFKLIILQVTAPIAIITTIEGGMKSKTFQSFYKTYFSVYTGLFTRVVVVYLITALINMFAKNFDSLNIGFAQESTMGSFAFIIIIVSLFTFAGKLPSFIDKALGLNSSGDGEGAAGFKGLMKSMGAAVGLGVGAAGGLALGAATGGVGGALGGMLGGGFRGLTGGYRANNVSDFFKNQGSGLSTTVSNSLRTKANGGILRDTALRFGAATGINSAHNARIDRQIQAEESSHKNAIDAENNSWNDKVKGYEANQAGWDAEIERENQSISALQESMAGQTSSFLGADGKAIRFGSDESKFINDVMEGDKGVIAAQAALSVAQNSNNSSEIEKAQRELINARNKAEKAARTEWKDAEDANTITERRARVDSINKTKTESSKAHATAQKQHDEKLSQLNSSHENTNKNLNGQKWQSK